MSVIRDVSKYLSFSIETVWTIADKAPHNYRRYKIRKRNGGYRIIHHPAKETKAIQYALINLIFGNYPIHKSAFAYKRGLHSPLKSNAEIHSKYKFTIRIDFKDFFHSIKYEDLENILHKPFSVEEKEFLRCILFLKIHGNYCLTIGSPSSPLLSNIIMFEYDNQISQLVNSIDSNATYTRYADDIAFSSNNKSNCIDFGKQLNELTNKIVSPDLTINTRKTIMLTKANRKIITGLIITPEGKISIGRKNKKYVKKLLNDLRYDKISPDNYKYLKGYLSFISDVEPHFINSVATKYGAELLNRVIKN